MKDGDAVLVEGTDYTLAYANNVNAGTATVTATGKGNYSCTKTVEFTIAQAEITAFELAATQKAVDDAVEALKKAVQDAKDAVEVITSINSAKVDANSVWYDMKGRKLEGKPTKKGVYVVNGRKVVIK